MSEGTKTSFSNHELVTVAIFLLCGDAKAADLEDIAKKVNNLAPGRFTWRKYPDQINIKNVDAFLWDAKNPKNGSLVLNVGRDKWILTAQGHAFARERVKDLRGVDISRRPMSLKERNWVRRERERMLGSDAFANFAAGKQDSISLQEAESFFRVDAYVTGTAREEKLIRAKNAFGDDPELGPVIKLLVSRIAQSTP
jgi:hypothetical protein